MIRIEADILLGVPICKQLSNGLDITEIISPQTDIQPAVVQSFITIR